MSLSSPALPKLSYVSGASDQPLLYKTVSRILKDVAIEKPENEALISVHQGLKLTYKEFDERVTKIAAGLVALGLKPGERVGIWSPNNVEWAITQFATARAGVTLVNINPAYRPAELEYVLNKVECAAIIIADKFKTSDYVEMLRGVAPHIFGNTETTTKAPKLRYGILINRQGVKDALVGFEALYEMGKPEDYITLDELEDQLQPEDPINIQFTSGTTGMPKGATLTHHNIVNNGYFVGEGIKLTERDRVCIPVPLYHCFGMVMGNIAAVTHGATMIYPGDGFDPITTLETIQKEKCTALYGVPTMFIAMLAAETFKDYDFSSLRTGIMAGSPCPIEIMRRVLSEMQMPDVTICYGMTETSPVSFQSQVDDPIEKRVSTVGVVHPHLEAKIIDENGKVLPCGEIGELCTRGYSVMHGYWGDQEATAKAIDAQGWMRTGDLAVISEDGYANITGRSKDVVIRGGENIYPKEIEEYLLAHEEIQDVQVFGVPDEKFGEVTCAWIVTVSDSDLTAESAMAWLKTKIAHYKIPAYARIVDEYPMTVTGKAQKFLMRDVMTKELNLKAAETA